MQDETTQRVCLQSLTMKTHWPASELQTPNDRAILIKIICKVALFTIVDALKQ